MCRGCRRNPRPARSGYRYEPRPHNANGRYQTPAAEISRDRDTLTVSLEQDRPTVPAVEQVPADALSQPHLNQTLPGPLVDAATWSAPLSIDTRHLDSQ